MLLGKFLMLYLTGQMKKIIWQFGHTGTELQCERKECKLDMLMQSIWTPETHSKDDDD